jgi:hypothetical protein
MTIQKSSIAGIAYCLMQCVVPHAEAGCNDPKVWFKMPGPDVKVLVGFEQELPYSIASRDVTSGSPSSPFPPLLATEELQELSKALSKTDTSMISYYERVDKNKWRICRREYWLPPAAGDEDYQRVWREASKLYVAGSSNLQQVTDGHMAVYALMYSYDAKGRIVKIDEGDFAKREESALTRICRKYDDQDRVTLLLNPRTTQSCDGEVPDNRDEWIRYRYGEVDGKQEVVWDEWHHGNAAGTWSKHFWTFRTGLGADDVRGAAKAKSRKGGVTEIYGSNAGKLDDNSANTVLNSFGQGTGATYYFTKPRVPLTVLEDPAAIYKYERRRQTYIDGDWFRMYELFKPNEHISHHRYYYVRSMLRDEQVDAKGRVTRVITVNDYRQPRPGPNPAVNDKLLTDKGLRIFGHQIYHRVYDFDTQGRPKLVAVSWNPKLRLNPLKQTHLDFAHPVFGTPDGKVRWNSLAEFEKAFGFSSTAADVFPDRTDSLDDDDD